MMWDLRGNDSANRPPSPNPRFPMPSPRIPSLREFHQSHGAFPKPFEPLGLPNAPVPRSVSPNPHMHMNARPPSRTRAHPPPVPHATRPPPSPRVYFPGTAHPPMSQPSYPPPMPVPAAPSPGFHHSSRIHHHAHTRSQSQSHRHRHHSSQSISAIPQAIHRTTSSQQLRFAPTGQLPTPSLQRASSSQDLKRSYPSQQLRIPMPHLGGHSGNHQRPRANSAGNRPVILQQQVQPHVHQHVVQHNGHVHFQYSKCTGRKKALFIGINYKGQRRELRGCINDVDNMKKFLISSWGYKEGDIVTLIDDTNNQRQMPTRRNIIDAMRWLVKDAQPHDALFFHYSGHGGQVPDKDGDETDGLDEVIYPVDYKKMGIILDDDMHSIMVKPLPPGCRLTAIFDSCHSGTALDLPYIYHSNGRLKGSHITPQARAQKATPADVISFSGCRDDQTSADTTQSGMAVGAMSYAFVRSLRMKPVQTYQEFLKSVRDILKQHYQQKPQLSSSHPIDTSLRFIL